MRVGKLNFSIERIFLISLCLATGLSALSGITQSGRVVVDENFNPKGVEDIVHVNHFDVITLFSQSFGIPVETLLNIFRIYDLTTSATIYLSYKYVSPESLTHIFSFLSLAMKELGFWITELRMFSKLDRWWLGLLMTGYWLCFVWNYALKKQPVKQKKS